MKIAIDPASRVAVSRQVRDELARRIERGRLRPGERLPTIRALAGELGLAANTVAKAYRELEEAGLVRGRGRSGTFVSDRLPHAPPRAERRLAEAARAYLARARQLGFDRATALEQVRRDTGEE